MTGRSDLLGHRESEVTFAGELTFLRRVRTRDIAGADVVFTGIPFDDATTFRSGARLGPQAIRAASVQLAAIAGRAFPFDLDLFETLAMADYGDCPVPSGLAGEVVTMIEAHAAAILDSGATLVSFGGDHFVSYPLLRAHAERYGPLALVHFDAHVDTWEVTPGRLDHGTMFLRALQEGLIDVEHSVQIGIRSFSERDHGFTVLTAPWIHAEGVAAAVKRVLDTVGDRRAYLTFDIDCLDPAFAPGTGTPVPGGLSSAQALGILHGLGDIDFVGADVVEVAPAYDHAEITALAAATIAHDFVGLLALRRARQSG